MKTKEMEKVASEKYDILGHNVESFFHWSDKDIWCDGYVTAMDEYASQFQQEWIRTANKKPENGERVLCNSIYGIQIGWISVLGDWQFSNGGSQLTLQHWMPLPKQPQPYNPTKS